MSADSTKYIMYMTRTRSQNGKTAYGNPQTGEVFGKLCKKKF